MPPKKKQQKRNVAQTTNSVPGGSSVQLNEQSGVIISVLI